MTAHSGGFRGGIPDRDWRSLGLVVLAVVVAFLAVAYGNDLRVRRGRQVSTWPSGAVRTQGEALRYPDGRVEKDGPYTEYHENGTVHLKGQYRSGKPEGLWREYGADGTVLKEGSYREGKADGLWHYYHPGEGPEHEELLWNRGRVVQDGRLVLVEESSQSLRFRWMSHLLGTLGTLLWLAAPLPLLFLLFRENGDSAGMNTGSGLSTTGDSMAPDLELPAAHGATAPDLELSAAGGGMALSACDSTEDAASQLVGLAVGWAVVQLSLLLILALVGALATVPFFLAQGLILVGGSAVWLRRGRPIPCLGILSGWRRDPILAALFAAGVVLTLAVLVKTLLVPMTDWDGLAYHLPLMAQWLQHHRLVDVPALGQTARYPSSFELLSLGGYFPFAEDFLFTLPALGAWVLLGISAFALARRLGAALEEAGATALLLLSLPLTLLQTEELKADLPTAAVFLSALVLGGLFDAQRKRLHWSLFWLSLALLCGMKASGPAYALVALAAVGWWRWKLINAAVDTEHHEEESAAGSPTVADGDLALVESASFTKSTVPTGARRSLFARIPFLLSLLLTVFLAAFWYVRNLVELGNPLGHVEFTALGHTFFSGPLSRAELWHTTFFALFHPFRGADWQALFSAERQWLGLGMAVLVVSAVAALARGWSRRPTRSTATLLFLLLFSGGILFGLTPFSGDNGSHGWRITPWVGQAMRYGLVKIAVLAVAAAWGWRSLRLPRWLTAVLAVGLCAWSVALRVAPPRPLLVGVVLVGGLLALAGLFWPHSEDGMKTKGRPETHRMSPGFGGWGGPKLARLLLPVFLLLTLALLAVGSHALRKGRESRRQALYDLPYLRTLTAPENETVGVAMTQLRYPFYGHDLRRQVVDVSNHDSPREAWMRRLDTEGVDVVAAGPRPVRRTFGPPESDLHPWLVDPKGPFVRLPGVGSESGEGIVFYEYQKEKQRAPTMKTGSPGGNHPRPVENEPESTDDGQHLEHRR